MAKKIVRGITDVKTINNQDFDTNNVNDLLSDGQYNYIHRKKGKAEEYHNLTDNIKTISSDNEDLLTVTNNNKTTNTATLHPKHDAQKEQVIGCSLHTLNIQRGANGTTQKTLIETNPTKVLEHDNLLIKHGISKSTIGKTTALGLEYTKVPDDFDLNIFENGLVRGWHLRNAPTYNDWYFVESFTESRRAIQKATSLNANNTSYTRLKNDGVWGQWREQVGDKSVIDALLAQKQNKLVAGNGISIQGQTISATGATTTTLKCYSVQANLNYRGYKQVVTDGHNTLVTFTFDCAPTYTERQVTGDIKNDIEKFVRSGMTVSNGGISIKNDGETIKLIKAATPANVYQHGTFTFSDV